MSGVGAIGGVSGASSAGASTGQAGAATATEGVSASSSVGDGSGSSGKTDAAEQVGAGQQLGSHSNSGCPGMSTEDSLKLRQTVQQPSCASEGGLDLKKLIELLMAIKLMEAMSDQGNGSSVGNNLDITA